MYKVLLVDDEKYIFKGLEAGIDWSSLNVTEVFTAQSGEAALALIDEKLPDVVVTDIRMPGMNGLELIQAAKAKYPNMPFIILSGYPDFAYAQKAMQYGVFRYLLKPFDLNELTECIRMAIATLSPATDDSLKEQILNSSNPTINAIIEFIDDNLEKELSVEMLSTSFGLTPNYLSALFKKETEEGIVEHITRLRMEKACDMLKNTDYKVQYICAAVGINDYFYFSKLFKRYMQMTPTGYRSLYKDNNEY